MEKGMREKVIERIVIGLACCKEWGMPGFKCKNAGCPYWECELDCISRLHSDVRALLKERGAGTVDRAPMIARVMKAEEFEDIDDGSIRGISDSILWLERQIEESDDGSIKAFVSLDEARYTGLVDVNAYEGRSGEALCAEFEEDDSTLPEKPDIGVLWLDIESYGKTWRCWTSRPTDAQREAVKWDI